MKASSWSTIASQEARGAIEAPGSPWIPSPISMVPVSIRSTMLEPNGWHLRIQ